MLSRQLKKYKFFLPVEIYLLAVFIVAPLAAYTPSARPVSTKTTGFLYVFTINSFNAFVYYILSNHIMEKCIEINCQYIKTEIEHFYMKENYNNKMPESCKEVFKYFFQIAKEKNLKLMTEGVGRPWVMSKINE